MDVLPEILPPGVEHHGDAEFAAEPPGVAAELEESLRGGVEQQPVDECGVALGDGVELVRQGKHDVPVADVEEVGALALDPPGLRERLALGAVTIPARGVLNRHRRAVLAARLESAECGGAAAHQRVHDPLLLGREPMRLPVGAGAGAQDIGDLQRRAGDRRRVHGMAHRSGPGATRELQQVQWGRGGGGLVLREVQVAHGRADGGMPEAALDDGQLDSGFKQPGRLCVPQGVDTARLGDSGLLFGLLVDMPGPVAAERASQEFIGEQPGLGTLATPVLAQLLQQPR